ncbi:unnamed protein product [Moneuplotes crassus]|uniref:Uncharacterized protein n=2 Tax=Euplotes crassus TaxID=5936 RepID=A0AAD1UJD4_EUPCR|nr:unnamed protein product [Moneuplotes crassus]
MGTIEDQIEKDLRIFKINGMEQIFAAEDYIFTLVKPLDHRYREITSKCKCCLDTIDTSKLNFCEFCGKNICSKKECLPKKRQFPKNLELRGECCIVCDRKFYIHELFAEFREKLDNITKEEKAIKEVIISKEKNIKDIDREIAKISDFAAERKFKEKMELNSLKIDRVKEALKIVDSDRKQIYAEKNRIIDEISKTEEDRFQLETQQNELENESVEINDRICEVNYKIKEIKEVLRTDYVGRKKTESFLQKQKIDMKTAEATSSGGCFSFFSSCKGPTQDLIPEENKDEAPTQDCSARESKEHEANKGSIISQYETGSFISKEFQDEPYNNGTTEYQPKQSSKKRRRKPQI